MTRWNLKHLVRTINSQRRSHSILLQIPYWQKNNRHKTIRPSVFNAIPVQNRPLTTRLLTAG